VDESPEPELVEEPPVPEPVAEPPDPEPVDETPDPLEDPVEVVATRDVPARFRLVACRAPGLAFLSKSLMALTLSSKSPSAFRSSSKVVPRADEAPAVPGTPVVRAGEVLRVIR